MGMSIFADFAIVETNCSSDVKPEDQDSCLTLCDHEAVSMMVDFSSTSGFL